VTAERVVGRSVPVAVAQGSNPGRRGINVCRTQWLARSACVRDCWPRIEGQTAADRQCCLGVQARRC
jgi:hypothetical protein